AAGGVPARALLRRAPRSGHGGRAGRGVRTARRGPDRRRAGRARGRAGGPPARGRGPRPAAAASAAAGDGRHRVARRHPRVRRAVEGDPLAAVRAVRALLAHAELDGVRAGLVGALLALGDRRVRPLRDGTWRALPPAAAAAVFALPRMGASRLELEWLLDWM